MLTPLWTSCCWNCGKSILHMSLGQHCRDVHGKTNLVKGQKTLSFTSLFGSKCEKSKDDNYDGSEKHKWVSMAPLENIPLFRKRTFWKNDQTKKRTAVCSSSYVTTNSCSNVSLTVDKKLDLISSPLSSLDLKLSGKVGSWEPEHPAGSKNPCTIDPAEKQFRQKCKTVSDICESSIGVFIFLMKRC